MGPDGSEEAAGGRKEKEGERVLIKSCNCFKPFPLLVSHPFCTISTLELEGKKCGMSINNGYCCSFD
jgi:hypothetical protein